MKTTTKTRLTAAPVYLVGLSIAGTISTVFIFTDGISGWVRIYGHAWATPASPPFVVGALLTAWAALRLYHRGRPGAAAALGFAGNYATFYGSVRILIMSQPPDPFLDPADPELLGAVLLMGAPGLVVGALAPIAWGRWEEASAAEA